MTIKVSELENLSYVYYIVDERILSDEVSRLGLCYNAVEDKWWFSCSKYSLISINLEDCYPTEQHCAKALVEQLKRKYKI